MIKLILLDVDGIMTDGKKYYDASGNVVLKTFCDKDWTAIKRFRALGIPVHFITGDPYNGKILENRNLPFVVNRGSGFHSDKINYLPEILKEYDADAADVVYVGDDIFDLNLLKSVGHGFCPNDAPDVVKNHCKILSGSGGDNLIMELYDQLEKENLITTPEFDQHLDAVYDLDVKETF